MKPFIAFAVFLFMFSAGPAIGVQPGKKFAIQLHRPMKVGTKVRLTVKGESSSEEERTVGTDTSSRKSMFKMEFRGVLTVKEITRDGEASKLGIMVEKFTLTEDGKTHEALEKGTRLAAALNGRLEVFALVAKDGKLRPLEDMRVVQALRIVVTLNNEGDANDDDIFGSKVARATGEKWPINKRLAIANMKRDGIILKPEKFSGQTRFPRVVKVGEVECVFLEGEFNATEFRPPIPKEFEVSESEFVAEYSGKFPLDKRLPELETTVDVRTSFTALAPAKGDRPAVDWSSTQRTRKHIWVEPLD